MCFVVCEQRIARSTKVAISAPSNLQVGSFARAPGVITAIIHAQPSYVYCSHTGVALIHVLCIASSKSSVDRMSMR